MEPSAVMTYRSNRSAALLDSHPAPARAARTAAATPLTAVAIIGLLAATSSSLGCNFLLGIEGTDESRDPPADAGPPPDAANPLACADVTVDPTAETAAVNTETSSDDLSSSCGGNGATEQTFAWTAPVTDYYVFDTFGSSFDTVLALYDSCDGSELSCNNNVDVMPQSELVRKFAQGEGALIAVEGFAGDSGQGSLNIKRVSCPDADLEGGAFPLDLTTVSFGDDSSGSCGGDGQEDRAYHFVAPTDGIYAFSVTAEGFNPVVTVLAGPRCADRELGCNAGASGIGHAEVVRRLRAGEPVSVIVDGVNGAGSFTIDITERTATCPEATLQPDLGVPDQLTTRVLAPSCAAIEGGGMFGGSFDLRDKTYGFDAPTVGTDCFGDCEITLRADEPMVLYVLEGNDCSGAEIACVATTPEGMQHTARLSVPRSDDGVIPYTIGVGDVVFDDGTGDFDLSSFCIEACP